MKKQFINLTIKSTNNGVNVYITFLLSILKKLNIKYKYIQLPLSRKRLTLIKSPHVNKKAREQFELQIFKKTIIIYSNINL